MSPQLNSFDAAFIILTSLLRAEKGEAEGHPFRGNQYVSGEGGGETETVFHGTSFARVGEILVEGIKSGKYANFEHATGLEKKVFVTERKDVAIFYAKMAEGETRRAGVVVEAKIPKKLLTLPDENELNSWAMDKVKPEWITNVYDTEGNVATKTINSLTGLKFKKAEKEDEVTVYIPLSEEVLRKIVEEKTPSKKQAETPELWGPDAGRLSLSLRKEWKRLSSPIMKSLRSELNVGEGKVNREAVNKLLKDLKDIRVEFKKRVSPKVGKVLAEIGGKAIEARIEIKKDAKK